jgi:hypothetical protein
MESITENITRPLVRTDICDKCPGAAAYVARSNTSRLELFFCNHHQAEYRDYLIGQDFYLDVETLDLR